MAFRAALLSAVLLSPFDVVAQEITASLSGTVKDPTGAYISNSTLTVINTDKNVVVRVLKTSSTGHYAAPLLPGGHYDVTAEAPGFKTVRTSGIELNVNDKRTIDFMLPVGATNEQVIVEAESLHVDLETPAAAGLISGTQIRELAINTRNYAQLVALQPGVSTSLTSDQMYVGVSAPNGAMNILAFSINGNRPGQNNWTLDGADNLDRGGNVTLLTYPSIDSIQEFQVLRGNYSPEFGRSSAGQINVITRSGTKNFHGGIYEFFRNDLLAANNFFNNRNALPRPPLRYNDFGFTFGGPLRIPGMRGSRETKTFFFYSQEWRRAIDYRTVASGTIATLAERQGTFTSPVCTQHDPNTGDCTATSTQITNFDPTAAAYIEDIFSKLPAPGPDGTLTFTARNRYDFREENVRIDHVFGPKLSIFGRYIDDSIPTEEPTGVFGTGSSLPGVGNTSTNAPGRGFTLRATMTLSPKSLNEVGYAYSYNAISSDPIGSLSSRVSPHVQPRLPFASMIPRVPDLLFFPGEWVIGFGPFRNSNRNHSVFDTVTRIVGRHSLKFGFSYNHYEKQENLGQNNNGFYAFIGPDPSGDFTFQQAWANFLLGRVVQFGQTNVDFVGDIRQKQVELFAQDEFRLRPNLTLTYGLRWSLFRQPTDGRGRATTFDPHTYDSASAPAIDINTGLLVTGTETPVLNGVIIGGRNSPFGDAVARQNNANVAPRIGFAWDPFRKGTTSVRGGYGVFYDSPSIHGNLAYGFSNPPFVSRVDIFDTSLSDPGSVVADPSLFPQPLGGIATDWKQPYTQQWSLDLQRLITPSTLFDIGYYGTKGTHLIGSLDINQPKPGAYLEAGVLPQGPIEWFTTQLLNYVRPFRGFDAINLYSPIFHSNYHSLQVQMQKRFRGSSVVVANYTWSHALTNASDDDASVQNIRDIQAEYGDAGFDRRHVFTGSYVYTLPFHESQRGVAGHLLGGWELSGIVYVQSGLPLTVSGIKSAIDPAGLGLFGWSSSGSAARPDQLGDPNQGAPHALDRWFNTSVFADPPAQGIRPGNARRNSVRGPGAARWDAALLKTTRIGEQVTLQFRAEASNVLNHTNLDQVIANFGDTDNFGKVRSARDPRIIQLGLKLSF
jgi:hypothetical protein